MKKIPVGATIAHAYRYVFTDTGTILKAMWLPLLGQLALIVFSARRVLAFMVAAQTHDPAFVSQLRSLLLIFVLFFILFFAQFAAATRAALGQPPALFAFPFGKPMWRLFGAFVCAVIAIAAVLLAAILLVWLAAWGVQAVVKIPPGGRLVVAILAGLIVLGFFGGVVFLALRFMFLLAPVNLSENRLGVGRSWELSAGNFWRILLITLAIMLPPMIINYGYGILLAGWPPALPGATPQMQDAAQTLYRVQQVTAMIDRWYLTLPLTVLLMLFQFGAGCAAQVFAYRTLVPSENEAAL